MKSMLDPLRAEFYKRATGNFLIVYSMFFTSGVWSQGLTHKTTLSLANCTHNSLLLHFKMNFSRFNWYCISKIDTLVRQQAKQNKQQQQKP